MELSSYNYENQSPSSTTVHLPLRRLRKEVSEYDEHNLNSNSRGKLCHIDQAPVYKGTSAIVTKGFYIFGTSNMLNQDVRQSNGHPQYHLQQRQVERSVCIKIFRYEVRKEEEQDF